jgi:hypothetical protein
MINYTHIDDDRERRTGKVHDAIVPSSPSTGLDRDDGRADLPVVRPGESRKALARRLV